MEKITSKFYDIEMVDRLVTITIKQDVFELLTNREYSDLLMERLNEYQSNPEIKALLFLNNLECLNEKVYDKFLIKNVGSEIKDNDFETPNFCDRKLRLKEINTLIRFVRYIANYKKLCFSVLSGNVVTPFIGAFLATDIRYATSDMSFSFAHNKYGLHPSGGLPYFLINQLGYNKAIELMLQKGISAEQALDLELINKVFPNENTLELVIKDIEKLIQYSSCSLRRTKELSSFTRNSLSNYFNKETILLGY